MKRTLAELKALGTSLLLSPLILAAPAMTAQQNGSFHSSLVMSSAMMQHAASAPAPHSAPATPQHSSSAAGPHSPAVTAPHSSSGAANSSKPNAAQHSTSKPTTSNPSAGQTHSGKAQHSTHAAGSTQHSSNNGAQLSSGNHPSNRQIEKRADGSTKVTRGRGESVIYDKNNRMKEVTTRGGAVAKIGPSGRVSVIQAKNTRITYGLHGRQQIESVRADHSRVVSMGHHYGFVEHPYTRHGHAYVSRTYVINGHTYARAYSTYYYHGAYFYHYVPAYYYVPAFYGWAYSPWVAPVYWQWGWNGVPWYTYYSYYFAPYPYYVSASLWLTDYLLAQNLQAAYIAGNSNAGQAQAVNPQSSGAAPISDELKQAIAEEVKAQLTAERDAAIGGGQPTADSPQPASSGDERLPDALDPRQRTFLVSASLDEQSSDGAECALTPGDVVSRIDDTPDANESVRVLVSSSKNKDCRAGSQLKVAVQDLQEMHNSFREQIDQGLRTLAQNQGSKGLPAAPDASSRPSEDGRAIPDLNASDDLQRQLQQARETELEVQQVAKQVS